MNEETARSPRLEVRPFETAEEYARMVDYFLGGSDEFLRGMGVDRSLLPARRAWLEVLLIDHDRRDVDKDRAYVAWLVGGEIVGHSSLSHIEPGEQAHVHLHLWRPDMRRSGLGRALFARSLGLYFERFRLKRIVCEPMADNAAPNRTLSRLGFRFVRRYRTTPTAIAFEQEVNRWEITPEDAAGLASIAD